MNCANSANSHPSLCELFALCELCELFALCEQLATCQADGAATKPDCATFLSTPGVSLYGSYMINKKWPFEEDFSNHLIRAQQVSNAWDFNIIRFPCVAGWSVGE